MQLFGVGIPVSRVYSARKARPHTLAESDLGRHVQSLPVRLSIMRLDSASVLRPVGGRRIRE
jgi:hypothetical protein